MTDVNGNGQAPVNRTLLIVLGGVVAFALLFFFVVSPLLFGGPDPDDELGEVVVVPTDTAMPSPAPTAGGEFDLPDPDDVDGVASPAETFEIFNARDPFQQLAPMTSGTEGPPTTDGTPPLSPPPTGGVVDGGTGTGTGTGSGTGTGTGDGTGTNGGTGNDGATGSDGTGSGGTNGGSDGNGSTTGSGSDPDDDSDATVGGTTVTLVDVFRGTDGDPRATVTVNGTGYTVSEGETFGRRFRLLDISGSCATMLFGDSRFTLCEGERIRK